MPFTTSEICIRTKIPNGVKNHPKIRKKKPNKLLQRLSGWGGVGCRHRLVIHHYHHLDVVSWWNEVKILLGRLLLPRFNLDLPVLPGSPTVGIAFTTKIRVFFSGKKVGGLRFEMQPTSWGMKLVVVFFVIVVVASSELRFFFDRTKPS